MNKAPGTLKVMRYRLRLSANGGNPLMVPSHASRKHLRELVANGAALRGVAAASGLHVDTISRIYNGKVDRILRDTERAILRTPLPKPFIVPAAGTQRRLQHLMLMGWTFADVDRLRGVSDCRTQAILGRDVVSRPMAETIAQIFEDLSRRKPPERDRYERMVRTRRRKTAADLGYVPIAAWDDIDDPREKPKGVRRAAA